MTRHYQRVLLAVAGTLAVLASGPGRSVSADSSFLIRHARVFDGKQVLRDTNVVVEAGIVRAVRFPIAGAICRWSMAPAQRCFRV